MKIAAVAEDAEFLLNLLTHRVPAGVDDAAKVKASYLAAVAHGTEKCLLLDARTRDRAARAPCSAATTSARWSTCWTTPKSAPSRPRA